MGLASLPAWLSTNGPAWLEPGVSMATIPSVMAMQEVIDDGMVLGGLVAKRVNLARL